MGICSLLSGGGGGLEIGFAILTGHGVKMGLYDDTFKNIEKFFAETPVEKKLQFRAICHCSVNQGYFPNSRNEQCAFRFGRRVGILSEGLQLGSCNICGCCKVWPDRIYMC